MNEESQSVTEFILNCQMKVIEQILAGETSENVLLTMCKFVKQFDPYISCLVEVEDKERKNLLKKCDCGDCSFNSKEVESVYSNTVYLLCEEVYVTYRFEKPINYDLPDKRYNQFFDSFSQLISLIAKQNASENKIIEKEYHDEITGLTNLMFFKEELDKQLNQTNISDKEFIIVIDLDRFKIFNGIYGYEVGSEILRIIANRLIGFLETEENDYLLSRYGSDKFILTVSKITKSQIETITTKLLMLISQPIDISGDEIIVTASIGISSILDGVKDKEELINQANIAVGSLKNTGGNSYALFNHGMAKNIFDLNIIEKELRKSITRKEFEIFYQPQINLKNNQLIGVEALLRWNNSRLGVISPSKFLRVAEESGLILAIDEWVLNNACKQVKKWHEKGYSSLRLSVNISSRLIQQKNIVAIIKKALSDYKFNPQNLVLEITESIFIGDYNSTIQKLKELQEIGVQIAIDDFGKAYSSLNYLKKLPINTVKIDRSFINEITNCPKDLEIVKAIISLGHGLNLKVVAEGVEQEKQLEILKLQNCDEVQGFFFNKPLPVGEFEKNYVV